jgi:DNA-binding CsgD family transcriptional regulator
MTEDVAYAKRSGRAGHAPRRIRHGVRRRKVADLLAQGLSERKIAAAIGVGKTTVARDKKWLKTSEHLLRAQEAADALVEAETGVTLPEEPTNVAEFRAHEISQVARLIAERKTYDQVAQELNISVSTVARHVNKYLAEYGDFGGRTMVEWRNEHLLASYAMMAEIQDDMDCQPIEGEKGWDLTPFQAQRTRDAARKRYLELMQYQARLLQLLVQKSEVDVQHKVVVKPLRGVDLSSFPAQGETPQLVDITPPAEEGEWST